MSTSSEQRLRRKRQYGESQMSPALRPAALQETAGKDRGTSPAEAFGTALGYVVAVGVGGVLGCSVVVAAAIGGYIGIRALVRVVWTG